MADIPAYVAVLSVAGAVVGAAIAPLTAVYQKTRQVSQERVRERSADANVLWVSIAFLAPGEVGESARRLAVAACELAAEVANTDLNKGASVRVSSLAELDTCIADFGGRAVNCFGGRLKLPAAG